MDELNFDDKTHTSKHIRPNSGGNIKPEQKRISKPHKFREIEALLEEKRLQDELCDILR